MFCEHEIALAGFAWMCAPKPGRSLKEDPCRRSWVRHPRDAVASFVQVRADLSRADSQQCSVRQETFPPDHPQSRARPREDGHRPCGAAGALPAFGERPRPQMQIELPDIDGFFASLILRLVRACDQPSGERVGGPLKERQRGRLVGPSSFGSPQPRELGIQGGNRFGGGLGAGDGPRGCGGDSLAGVPVPCCGSSTACTGPSPLRGRLWEPRIEILGHAMSWHHDLCLRSRSEASRKSRMGADGCDEKANESPPRGNIACRRQTEAAVSTVEPK